MELFKTKENHINIQQVQVSDPLVIHLIESLKAEVKEQHGVIELLAKENMRQRQELEDKNEELKKVYALLDAAQSIIDQVSKQLVGTAAFVSKLRVDMEVKRKNRRI